MDIETSRTTGAQTLDRGIRLLRHLAGKRHGQTLTELSRDLGVNRTAVHRMLETFLVHGFVHRDADKRFHLSYGVVELAGAVHTDLRAVALPILEKLAARTAATTHLMVPMNDMEVQALLVVEPQIASVHLAFRTGQRHPIERGSGGIAILAGRPELPTDGEVVREARAQGYAVTFEEVVAGVTGVSAPVSTPPGQPEVSLGVSLVDRAAVASASDAVLEAARELEQALASRSHA